MTLKLAADTGIQNFQPLTIVGGRSRRILPGIALG